MVVRFTLFYVVVLQSITNLKKRYVSFGLQFRHQWKANEIKILPGQNKTDRALSVYPQAPKISSCLVKHPELKPLFVDFAAKQYVSENFTFLEEVSKYRDLFYDKNEVWRSKTAKTITDNYIREGGLRQVNISGEMASSILDAPKPTIRLFDEAVAEIENLLELGPWFTFYWKYVEENRLTPST